MSERDKQIGEALGAVIPILPEEKKEYLIIFVDLFLYTILRPAIRGETSERVCVQWRRNWHDQRHFSYGG